MEAMTDYSHEPHPSHPAPDPNESHGSIFDGLLGSDSSQWAFGTDFEDPLAGVDTTIPDGVDHRTLATYCLMLGRRRPGPLPPALRVVLERARTSRRTSRWPTSRSTCSARPGCCWPGPPRPTRPWCPRCPRVLRCRRRTRWRSSARPATSATSGSPRSPTATSRTPSRGCCCSPRPGSRCSRSWPPAATTTLAAVAVKGAKELTYHRDYSGRWFLTLAQGTAESRRRLEAGLTQLWPLYAEMFGTHEVEADAAASGVGVDPATVADEVDVVLEQVFAMSDVERPTSAPLAGVRGRTGRDGLHTEALSLMLAEMQVVARAHPSGRW